MVKSGRFGRFLACPGYPECTFTMPLVVEMPGRCPKCGGRLMKRTGNSKKTGKQYTYYCCEHVNSKDETGEVRLHDLGRAGEGRLPGLRPHHVQEGGPGIQEALLHQSGMPQLPAGGEAGLSQEEGRGQRRGRRRPAAAAEETAEKKPARRTAAAKKADTAKTAAKKSAAKKPAAAKTAAKKPAAKKETASKAAAKTTSTRKTAAKKTVASKAKKPAGKE